MGRRLWGSQRYTSPLSIDRRELKWTSCWLQTVQGAIASSTSTTTDSEFPLLPTKRHWQSSASALELTWLRHMRHGEDRLPLGHT